MAIMKKYPGSKGERKRGEEKGREEGERGEEKEEGIEEKRTERSNDSFVLFRCH